MKTFIPSFWPAVALLLCAGASAHAQRAFTWPETGGAVIAEDFRDFRGSAATLPDGFQTGAAWRFRGEDDGSLPIPGWRAYRTRGSGAASLGFFSGRAGDGGRLYLEILNNTGLSLTHLRISYVIERWRAGRGRSLVTLHYGSLFEGAFTSMNDLVETRVPEEHHQKGHRRDGKAPSNRVHVDVVIALDEPLQPGQLAELCWEFSRIDDGTAEGLAISDVFIEAL